MKKKLRNIIVALMIGVTFVSLVGCTSKEEYLNENITELEAEIAQLESERDSLKDEIVDIKVENGTAKYVITFNIKQNHYTLDLTEHMKDEMNAISIQIPVDKEYYDSVEVGDTIDDSFRMGSLVMKGSFGSWDITVEDKMIQ